MSKITKQDLNERLLMVETLLGLHRKLPEQISVDQANNAIFRMQCALSNGREIAERQPKLKQLDQSVFDGLDEKWRFAGVDDDGRAFKFDCEPAINCNEWYEGHGQQKTLIGEGYDASNWQNSLIERERLACEESDFLNDTISNIVDEIIDIEYFYSNITSALLESGSKLVVCFVSNVSESNALSNKRIEVITSLDTGFDDTDGYGWQYAVPINNQGEPLTAKEAGL